jgi:hypothetical protein
MVNEISRLSKALREAFASPRQLELAAGCSHPSASRYWNGHGIPNVVLLARMMRKSQSFATAFWEYCGLDPASLDAESVRLRQDYAALQKEFEALDAEYQRLVAARAERVAKVGGRLTHRCGCAGH